MKELVIGFLGCGNVGGGVWKLLEGFEKELAQRANLKIRVKKVLVRNVNKARTCSVPQSLLTTCPEDVLCDPEITLVAEFMGGEQPATEYMLRALKSGKTVVTANKMALALNWHRLHEAARHGRAGLYYEASVCGAIPVIDVLSGPMQSNRISSIMGIINGTTNYILSRMYEQGEDYAAVLADAQKLGLAEPDPSSDVEGMDAAYKLSIMASLAFHTRVPFKQVYREGITGVTQEDIAWGKELGYVMKLLAVAKREGDTVEVRVHPTFLPKEHPLSRVHDSFNAVYLSGHACKEMMLQGRGAGDLPTASAIVGDIMRAGNATEHFFPDSAFLAEPDVSLQFTRNWNTRFFVRMSAVDAPGTLEKIAGCLARENVSIATMVQRDAPVDGRLTLVLITHSAPEMSVQAALAAMPKAVCQVQSVIRTEG
ncbi:MAG: homoserine dehydrogenase [Clostridiales bacterium]|nr:homoserine dehydrogenase [Clostridiales bacterium]